MSMKPEDLARAPIMPSVGGERSANTFGIFQDYMMGYNVGVETGKVGGRAQKGLELQRKLTEITTFLTILSAKKDLLLAFAFNDETLQAKIETTFKELQEEFELIMAELTAIAQNSTGDKASSAPTDK